MPLTFTQNFTVLNHECDAWGRMKPGEALCRVQEISVAQCESLGITGEVYARTGTAFLLSRVSLAMHHMPRIGDEVRMQTSAYGMKRAVFHRVTRLYGADDTLLCEADARWLLVDVESRRIHRRVPEGFPELFTDTDVPPLHDVKVPKVEPESLRALGTRRASYTLCDTNGHINNTRYADMVMDSLPLESLKTALPRRLLLVYHHEIPLGGSFKAYIAQQKEEFYFAARKETHNDFEAYVWL